MRILESLFYLFYLVEHKYYILLEGRKLGVGFWQLLLHDISKFSQAEFVPYLNRFYPKEGRDKEEADIEFEVAWQHHVRHNPHHWQHWLEETDNGRVPKEMPKNYALEMVADWKAVSRKFKNDPYEWYRNRKSRIKLHENTARLVEYHLSGAATSTE